MMNPLTPKRPLRAVPMCFLPLLGCVALGNSAHAAEGDTFTPYVEYGIYHDDNLQRRTRRVVSILEQNGFETSDRWQRAEVGVKVDKPLGRQRLTANLALNQTKYENFDEYDNDGSDARVNLAWVMGNYFDGNAGVSYNESLTPFEDFSGISKSVRTQSRAYVDGGWRFHPDWRASVALSQYRLRYEQEIQQVSERDVTTGDIGIDYTTRAGNTIGVHVRHIDGDYPNAPFNQYTQDEINAKVAWQVTGKTSLQFLGGVAKRRYEQNSNRDSSGPNARLNVLWAATGKTSFILSVWREIGATEDLAANYAMNKGARLSTTWKATAKITADASFMTEKRDYNGVAVVAGITPSDRRDDFRRAALGVNYAATRNWNFRLAAYRENLDSNIATQGYRTNGVQLTTRFQF